jgi:HSP20 family molecular chaperone IbpA
MEGCGCRVRVIPSGFGFGGIEEAFRMFHEMMGSMGEAVSQFPANLVCGDFPPTNIITDKDENFIVQMSVAGYPEDGVVLSYKDEYLVVTCTPDEKQFDGLTVKMRGIRNSKGQKKILVPSAEFDVNKANAATKEGILTIMIPRKEEAKPVSIPISKG